MIVLSGTMRLGEGVLEEDDVMAFTEIELDTFSFNCKLAVVIHVSTNNFRLMATFIFGVNC